MLDEHTTLPRLRPRQRRSRGRAKRGSPKRIDVPTKAQHSLATRFVTGMRGARGLKPFLVNVVNGKQLVAALAYGANPGNPKAEFVTYLSAPVGEDWRGYLRSLVEDGGVRARFGVGGGGDARVSLKTLRESCG